MDGTDRPPDCNLFRDKDPRCPLIGNKQPTLASLLTAEKAAVVVGVLEAYDSCGYDPDGLLDIPEFKAALHELAKEATHANASRQPNSGSAGADATASIDSDI